MRNKMKNPFLHHKFEDETSAPLMTVSEEALLQTKKNNLYFFGKRGCGKTSALKLADEEFRLRYPEAFGNDDISSFEKAYGLYISIQKNYLPEFKITRNYKKKVSLCQNEDTINDLSLIYFEMLVFNNYVMSLQSLLSYDPTRVSLRDEKKICHIISRSYLNEEYDNFSEIGINLQSYMTDILELARGLSEDIKWYKPRIKKIFYDTWAEIFTGAEHLKSKEFLRICVDDAEGLTQKQQFALNTLVRSPENSPVSWSVAFVTGQYDPSKTLNPSFSNRSDDLKTVQLDNLGAPRFQSFCERIMQVRLSNFSEENITDHSLKKVLGTPEISELMVYALSKSSSQRSKKLLDEFNNQKNRIKFLTFYIQKNGMNLKNKDGIRRKSSAALIHLCHNYALTVPYAGFDIIISLCDGCIRDFIEIMRVLFQEAEKENRISDFLGSSGKGIPYDLQVKSCKIAAEEKLKTAVLTTYVDGSSMERFILYIGHYAAAIQGADSKEPIQNPDRGIFMIPENATLSLNKSKTSKVKVVELIKNAEVDGYLKSIDIESANKGMFYFRLHFRVAPYFKSSYRTYSDLKIELKPKNVLACDNQEKRNIKALAIQHYKDWARKRFQGELNV